MALPASFLDELRARTPLHGLVARRVKLKKSGRNWTGCCPFHNEKSPSFYVYEDGFHCFGCGAHGDAISFVMQTSGSSFMETVESLAAEAGLEVPKQSPREAEREQERLDLFGVMDAVQAEFVRLLHTPAGAAGLAYLRGRALSDETIARFGLGWSGDGRGSLVRAVAAAGIVPGQLEECGLLRPADENGPQRELYWGRVTFPIRDRRGRVISFGGRTLGDGKPKYINGPETRLFQKKHTLYALDLAREGARRGKLVVAEGYMDVIGLHQAGFAGAVAPMGTALTEEQLEALWRISPAPILCFDGDAAGARAAARVAELCLPLISAERSVLFARLPGGKDPDDLVRRDGAAAFQGVLDAALPLADALFEALGEGLGEGPESRAMLRARLDAAAARIADKTLAAEYRSALRSKFFEQKRGSWQGGGRTPGKALPSARRSRTPPSFDAAQADRARFLVAILLWHPGLLNDTEAAFTALELPPELDRVRDAMLNIEDHATLDSDAMLAHLTSSGLSEDVTRVLAAPLPLRSARREAMPAEAGEEWWHFFGLIRGPDRLDEEIAEAERGFNESWKDAAWQRLKGLSQARLDLFALEDET